MKKLIFVLIAALGVSCSSYAQMTEKEIKKATKTAQKIVKNCKSEMENDAITNKSNAKKLIDQAMNEPLLQNWDQTWVQAANVYRHFYNEENQKTFRQGVKYDTVNMYTYLDKWFTYTLKADSLQQIPNAKGKTSQEVRKTMIPYVASNLGTLIHGGVFYFNYRGNKEKAYYYFDRYFTLAQNEILKPLVEEDATWQQMRFEYAYYPALAAFQMNKYENSLKYGLIAMECEEYGSDATEIVAESYAQLQDTTEWLKTLKVGLVKYPESKYFYAQLLNYYSKKNDMSSLEAFVKEMIDVDPNNAYNYYVLGYINQSNKEYEKAIEQYKISLEKDPNLAVALNNIGRCLIWQSQIYMDEHSTLNFRSEAFKKAQAQEQEYYRQALPYFEKMREIQPDNVSEWGIPLQMIYDKLKMPQELNKIETLLKVEGLL